MLALDLTNAQWRKSSYSSPTADCVEVAFSEANWRKSTRSTDTSNCVEVAFDGPAVGLRDSKNPDGPLLALPLGSWHAFLAPHK